VTFAQSALAPARITRVSVTHHGETPHLDVIVEDEQLSLAIGKRGQNVRLASELIGAEIDIKSESDVKDEVADALAKMLQVDLGGAKEPVPLDLTEAPGIGPAMAAKLEEAGFAELGRLVQATPEELQAIEGVGPKSAAALLEWAQGRQSQLASEAEAASGLGGLSEMIESAESGSRTMDDRDFMAALSKAFQESEQSSAAADAAASKPAAGAGESADDPESKAQE
jgi:N utilization substance protein A